MPPEVLVRCRRRCAHKPAYALQLGFALSATAWQLVLHDGGLQPITPLPFKAQRLIEHSSSSAQFTPEHALGALFPPAAEALASATPEQKTPLLAVAHSTLRMCAWGQQVQQMPPQQREAFVRQLCVQGAGAWLAGDLAVVDPSLVQPAEPPAAALPAEPPVAALPTEPLAGVLPAMPVYAVKVMAEVLGHAARRGEWEESSRRLIVLIVQRLWAIVAFAERQQQQQHTASGGSGTVTGSSSDDDSSGGGMGGGGSAAAAAPAGGPAAAAAAAGSSGAAGLPAWGRPPRPPGRPAGGMGAGGGAASSAGGSAATAFAPEQLTEALLASQNTMEGIEAEGTVSDLRKRLAGSWPAGCSPSSSPPPEAHRAKLPATDAAAASAAGAGSAAFAASSMVSAYTAAAAAAAAGPSAAGPPAAAAAAAAGDDDAASPAAEAMPAFMKSWGQPTLLRCVGLLKLQSAGDSSLSNSQLRDELWPHCASLDEAGWAAARAAVQQLPSKGRVQAAPQIEKLAEAAAAARVAAAAAAAAELQLRERQGRRVELAPQEHTWPSAFDANEGAAFAAEMLELLEGEEQQGQLLEGEEQQGQQPQQQQTQQQAAMGRLLLLMTDPEVLMCNGLIQEGPQQQQQTWAQVERALDRFQPPEGRLDVPQQALGEIVKQVLSSLEGVGAM